MRNVFIKLIIVFMLIFPSLIFSESTDNSDDNFNKNKIKVKPDFKFESEVEVGIRDKDDTEILNIGLDKNSPQLEGNLDLFIKLVFPENKKIIFGPYFNFDSEIRFDYRDNNENTIFMEKHFSRFDSGVKTGYKFGKKKIKGSYFIFNFPFLLDYSLLFNDDDKSLVLPENQINDANQYTDLRSYHTRVLIGGGLGFKLYLKSKKKYMRFILEDNIRLQGELLRGNYTSDYSGLYFENENIILYKIAPFNYINKKVDVWFNLYNRFIFSYDSYNFGLNLKSYFEISWKGFKYLNLGWKPVLYRNKLKIPVNDINLAYDQYHSISMEVWLGAGNKIFWAVFSYEPYLFALDAPSSYDEINVDSLKPHYISLSIELKY